MKKYIVGLVALMAPFTVANAEGNICETSSIPMPASTPTERFASVAGNEDVFVDKKTGLMWQRCTYGFSWNAGTFSCVEDNNASSSLMSWPDALSEVAVQNANVLYGYSDWRLPNLKELASIIERKCVGLSINIEVFPGTKASRYWTNTHRLESTDIRVVDFNGGVIVSDTPYNSALYFRLVRDNN